jgi:hypothetical protein
MKNLNMGVGVCDLPTIFIMRIIRNEAGVRDDLSDGNETTVGIPRGESRGDVRWSGGGRRATVIGGADEHSCFQGSTVKLS